MRRLFLLSCLLYAWFLLGLLTLRGELLALAIPLAVYLGAAYWQRPESLELSAERRLVVYQKPSSAGSPPVVPPASPSVSRVDRGTLVEVRLAVVNRGIGLDEVLLEDAVPADLRVIAGQPRLLVSLPAGARVELAYTFTAERGEWEFPGVQVTAWDHTGLTQHQAAVASAGKLLVLPGVPRLQPVPIRPLRTRIYAGPVQARLGGTGTTFFGVREYQPGDPRRWISWQASARHMPVLFTKEFEQERVADIGIILDARQRREVRANGDSLFEHSVQAAAALAEAFLNDGNRVGLLIYGWHLAWTHPGYGKVQRERILTALARAETIESMRLDYLPTRLFPARSQLVVISSLNSEDLPVFTSLRARGYQLLIITPDPVAFEARALPRQPDVILATRIARLERQLLLRQLYGAGITVVDWQVEEPLDRVLCAALRGQPVGHRIDSCQ